MVHLARGALDGRAAGDEMRLEPDQQHHLRRVLRLRDGAPLVLADGEGRCAAAVVTAAGARLVEAVEAVRRPGPAIEVVHALPKGRRLDEVVRALTELGVDRIRPVTSDRTVATVEGERAGRAVRRWDAIAAAAAAQSRQPYRPEVAPVRPVRELEPAVGALTLFAHPAARTSLRGALSAHTRDGGVGAVRVAIGPEGGWSDAELEHARRAGAIVVSLGNTVLRTEHAAVVVVAIVAYTTRRLGGRDDRTDRISPTRHH